MDTIRAWKDPEYRDGLSGAERRALADNPAGTVHTEGWLATAGAGQQEARSTIPVLTNLCCFRTPVFSCHH